MILTFLLSSPPPQSNFFNDNFWQLIAVIISLVGIITSIFVSLVTYRQQRTQKALTYDVISDTPIASIRKSLGNKVEVFFESKKVDELRLVIIKLWNSGNVAVSPDDYFEPISFNFEKSQILDCDIVEEVPEEINASIQFDENQVTLKSTFLNPKDTITIKILLDGAMGKINVRGRIVNAVLIRAK